MAGHIDNGVVLDLLQVCHSNEGRYKYDFIAFSSLGFLLEKIGENMSLPFSLRGRPPWRRLDSNLSSSKVTPLFFKSLLGVEKLEVLNFGNLENPFYHHPPRNRWN